MEIVRTDVTDINYDNIDLSKIQFADDIIKVISPLFIKIRDNKSLLIEDLEKEFMKKKINIGLFKKEAKEFNDKYRKEKEKKQTLDKLLKIVDSGLIKDELKSEFRVFLKVIDTLSSEEIDSYVNRTIQIKSKNI
jgi:hypothetical protein